MNEKVYCVNDFYDMTIIEGIAAYNGKNYFFECIFDDDNWSDIYNLTLLDKNIFKISMENWKYWKHWLKDYRNGIRIIPHSVNYAKERQTKTMEEILFEINKVKDTNTLSEKNYTIKSAENYYQNKIIIKNYLENNKPIYRAKGTFYGDINGIENTEVKWENVVVSCQL
jgi:hypothetical protein